MNDINLPKFQRLWCGLENIFVSSCFTVLIYEKFLGMMLTIWVTTFVNIIISTVYKQVVTVKYIVTALEKFYF